MGTKPIGERLTIENELNLQLMHTGSGIPVVHEQINVLFMSYLLQYGCGDHYNMGEGTTIKWVW